MLLILRGEKRADMAGYLNYIIAQANMLNFYDGVVRNLFLTLSHRITISLV